MISTKNIIIGLAILAIILLAAAKAVQKSETNMKEVPGGNAYSR